MTRIPCDLTIIIPVFNEGSRISHTLKALDSFFKNSPFACFIVNDGSTDESLDILTEFARSRAWLELLSSDSNKGKGAAIKKGMSRVETAFAFFMDADLPVPLHTLKRAVGCLEGSADMVIGSRAHPESRVRDRSLLRKGLSLIGNHLIRSMTGLSYGDTQCGFKGFTRRCAHDLFQNLSVSGYLFDVELLLLARKMGYNVKQIPVNWSHVPDGSFRPLFDSLGILAELVRLSFLHRFL